MYKQLSSGLPLVDRIGRLSIKGNVVPQAWFQHLNYTNKRGTYTHHLAILLLADIVYWYRPSEVRDETTGEITGLKAKFWGDSLQRSYDAIAEQLGSTYKQAREALLFLEEKGLIKTSFRSFNTKSGLHVSNALFIEPIAEQIEYITYHVKTEVSKQHSSQMGKGFSEMGNALSEIGKDFSEMGRTYTYISSNISSKISTLKSARPEKEDSTTGGGTKPEQIDLENKELTDHHLVVALVEKDPTPVVPAPFDDLEILNKSAMSPASKAIALPAEGISWMLNKFDVLNLVDGDTIPRALLQEKRLAGAVMPWESAQRTNRYLNFSTSFVDYLARRWAKREGGAIAEYVAAVVKDLSNRSQKVSGFLKTIADWEGYQENLKKSEEVVACKSESSVYVAAERPAIKKANLPHMRGNANASAR